MEISIENAIVGKYPKLEIGYLAADVVVNKRDDFVENLKASLPEKLKEMGIDATNFTAHPNLSIWRKIYKEEFQVKESVHRSSLEALIRRVVAGKELWNICNVVDLYNCCSVLTLFPMGGYDLNKISGDIVIRHAKEEEPFQGIGEKQKEQAKTNHIVYADSQRLICWLWNHKDAIDTCIDENTKRVIFFIDSINPENPCTIQSALGLLFSYLKEIGGEPFASGILNKETPRGSIK